MPYLVFTGEVVGEHKIIKIDDDDDNVNTFKVGRQIYNAFSKNEKKKI
jgi:hypothetical protein